MVRRRVSPSDLGKLDAIFADARSHGSLRSETTREIPDDANLGDSEYRLPQMQQMNVVILRKINQNWALTLVVSFELDLGFVL